MDSPVDYFEKVIRAQEESALPTLGVDVDRLLFLSAADKCVFTNALTDYYGQSHWSSVVSNFKSATEAAFQMVAAGLCRLKDRDEYRPNDLECCVRVVHSPSLAAYVIREPHNYIVVPIGFVASVQSYISTIYALASIGAVDKDPSCKSNLWKSDTILGSLIAIWEKDERAFLEGVFEYSSQLSIAPIVDSFEDNLAFTGFDLDIHKKSQAMMNLQRLRELGFTNTEETLENFQEVGQLASSISKLLLTYAICHELGHLFMSTVPDSDAGILASDETLADQFGTQILWRLYETRFLERIYPKETNFFNVVSAIMAFHSWNLSKGLAEILAKVTSGTEQDLQHSLDNVHKIAKRWDECCMTQQKALTTNADGPPSEAAVMLTNSWSIPCAGMLLMNARFRGRNVDLYEAGKLLPLLTNRQSKLYQCLSKSKKSAR